MSTRMPCAMCALEFDAYVRAAVVVRVDGQEQPLCEDHAGIARPLAAWEIEMLSIGDNFDAINARTSNAQIENCTSAYACRQGECSHI